MKRVCQYCGKELTTKCGRAPTCKECSFLYTRGLNRIYYLMKNEKPKHTPEELNAIKKKYSAGVPAGEIENWIKEL